MSSRRYIISGGGTGGHIFPAIAIANALKKEDPGCEVLFVGAKGRMEMEKVPEAGYEIEGLWISGLQRSLSRRNLSFPFKLISSLLKSRRILRRFKPDACIGVGGYASGPLLYAASGMGIPTLIQEQNSYPGITNKLLAKRVNKICVAYEGMERFFPKEKIIITGNPIRQNVIQIEGKRDEAHSFFGTSPHKTTVLSIGGSLGARTINEALESHLKDFQDNDVQLIWQTGKGYAEKGEAAAKPFDLVKNHTFIREMDKAYAAADIIISRAGAIAVSELCNIGKPVILVPSPFVAEDHQTKNAMALVERDASMLVKDTEMKEKLWSTLSELLRDETKQKTLSANIKQMARADADRDIANEIQKLFR